ncbi:MAG: aminomethyl-transferring glycine dehydrogenase subunit GcvPA [Acidobacteria bacterium]|nr:MAG: aminomethyl-transferring glycine dehydrogenase subunit GcvPA [Acidobacteriota bacterium]
MSFIPHTDADVGVMLDTVGLDSTINLFDSIPDEIRLDFPPSSGVPQALSEPELIASMKALAGRNRGELVCFAGGGAYDAFVPAAVSSIAAKPEFATAYTPYQAEVSQGVLQALFEYQTLICRLTGMEVANASLYDGATALVEGVALAAAVTGKSKIVVGAGLNPRFRQVLETVASGHSWDITSVPLEGGVSAWPSIDGDVAAVVVQHPNYLGCLEDVGLVTARASEAGALSVVVTDPISNGILKTPGALGADVVVGEGQQLGGALNFGGPYLGIFATKDAYLRQVPGRIVGETVDADGKRAYALALQAREQHIRREKASSNICTNQTLMAIAATAALAWLGPQGLRRAAESSSLLAHYLADRLCEIPGCSLATTAPFFREFALKLPLPAADVIERLADEGFLAGVDLTGDYPDFGDAMLVAVTENRTRQQADQYVEAMNKVIKK